MLGSTYEILIEKRTAAGNRINGVLGALLRWQNVSAANVLGVHNAVLVPTLCYMSVERRYGRRIKKERKFCQCCGDAVSSDVVN